MMCQSRTQMGEGNLCKQKRVLGHGKTLTTLGRKRRGTLPRRCSSPLHDGPLVLRSGNMSKLPCFSSLTRTNEVWGGLVWRRLQSRTP